MKKHYKLPRIYRFITDFNLDHRLKLITVPILGFIMIFLIVVSLYGLYNNYQSKKKIDLERQEVISKIEKWKAIVSKYKDYRDGYFQLAILEYRLRHFTKSKLYLDKVLALDPNFEKGRMLEKILNR